MPRFILSGAQNGTVILDLRTDFRGQDRIDFQLDKYYMGIGHPNIFSGVNLGREPTGSASSNLYIASAAVRMQLPRMMPTMRSLAELR